MDLIQVVLLALVQALTEFLPVSSTAHLVLVPWLMGWEDYGLFFDVALHVGTLLAVLVYFAKTWIRLISISLGRRVLVPGVGHPDVELYDNPKLFAFLVAATFPAGVAGLALKSAVETSLRSPVVIGVMLIAVGVLIWAVERRVKTTRGLDSITLRDAMLVGFAQAVALVPGTSRSGITIVTGLLLGLSRESAARFSFLLSSPIIMGAALKTAYDASESGTLTAETLPALLLGIGVSAVAGYAVIAFFLKYLQTSTLTPFVYYRVGFGILVLALVYSSASLPAAFSVD